MWIDPETTASRLPVAVTLVSQTIWLDYCREGGGGRVGNVPMPTQTHT